MLPITRFTQMLHVTMLSPGAILLSLCAYSEEEEKNLLSVLKLTTFILTNAVIAKHFIWELQILIYRYIS